MYPVINECPVCDGELIITNLECRECDTNIKGRFISGPFGELTNAQIAFVELANSFGRIRFHFALPPRAHNVRLFAQALDLATGEMSLVTEQTIR